MPPSSLPLRQTNLLRLAARLPVPEYDRSRLRPGVVHLSVGCFHRSHQAVYFDALARRGVLDWGIVGVSHRRREVGDVLRAQDGLYTVIARGPEHDETRVVGAHVRHLHGPQDPAAVTDVLAASTTRLVTLTITGSGYAVDPEDALRALPRTVPGLITAALERRFRAGMAPFTVLSCDNLAANGSVARASVLALARRRDPALAAWIESHGAFPNCLVDRITPGATDDDRLGLQAELGLEDACPVVTEPFSQWIIEDAFCAGRPPLEEVGVRFVDDVRPYALVKTRLLNGTHCALGYLGSQAGHRTTDEAMRDPALAGYLRRLHAEVRPLLPDAAGMDLPGYEQALLARVGNRRLGDQLPRLCRNGSAKVPSHLIASIAEARARGRDHPALTLAVAAWMRHLRGWDHRGRPHRVEDPAAARLQPLARAGGTDPRPLLAQADLFGDLGRDEGFAEELEAGLRALEHGGVRAVLSADRVPAGVAA